MSKIQEEYRNAFDNIMSDVKDGINTGSAAIAPSFKKNDQGKLQWSLMPFEELEETVKVLMIGAKKYGKDNWKKCDDVNRYKDALMRHVTSYIKGDKLDSEDKLSHLAHAICNCLFLQYFDNQIEHTVIEQPLPFVPDEDLKSGVLACVKDKNNIVCFSGDDIKFVLKDNAAEDWMVGQLAWIDDRFSILCYGGQYNLDDIEWFEKVEK